jgi:asparagine synthase (glutamine-hydrolysing)
MCGWTGFWKHGAYGDDELRGLVTRMADTLVHRGPDDSGTWTDAKAGLALGFRRLSILDLTPAGHQPMVSADGRFVIVFNGEVYNFADLRVELEALGHRFRGGSDTEVMLEAIDRWGVEAATQKFVGMFAFALWDRTAETLTLGRDRMGKKPLYYGWSGSTLMFGSELKALRAHPDFRVDVDRGALTLFLRHNAIPSPYTIYSGIRQVPPGCLLQLATPTAKDATPRPYWSLREAAERGMHTPFAGSAGEATERLDTLLRDAVRLRMIADVPLGAFLSGGVDSSTVVALMQAQSSRPVNTFSIGFEEDEFNEAPHAKAVANHLGAHHTELYVTAAEAREAIPRLPDIYDEPFADASQIPTFLLSQLARRSVTVSLSGDGADELFAGYPHFLGPAEGIWRKLRWLPPIFRRAIARSMRAPGRGHRLGQTLHRLSDIFLANTPEALYHRLVSHWKTPADVVIDGFEPPTVRTDPAMWPEGGEFTDRMLFFDTLSYLPDDIFTKVDRASMAASLETRMPLVDHRVVELAWQLPLALKIREGEGKWILRQVLHRYVPRELVERPKMGFCTPIRGWLRGPLREWAEALLDERRLRDEGYFHPAPIREKWTEHLAGTHQWEYYLWDVLMFQSWLERWGK